MVAKNSGTLVSETELVSTYFKAVSKTPEPTKSSKGKSKFLNFTGELSFFADDKYTAINANKIPTTFTTPTLSLYTIIPNIIGITTDIFPATDATDNPFFCAVIPITLKIEINKNPKQNAPINQGCFGTSATDIEISDVKTPKENAII